uniref:hypothetical protein n=1 Tax=uncultured Allobacillus sp. TaxID=1638025 RepID=UPI00259815CF|nr:hypothetical protein [uncultured Allobacillus sp.]
MIMIKAKFVVRPGKKIIAILGMIISLVFLSLLLIPGSPAFLGIESRISLVIWVILGIAIYLAKRKSINEMSENEMNYLVVGELEVKLKNQ